MVIHVALHCLSLTEQMFLIKGPSVSGMNVEFVALTMG